MDKLKNRGLILPDIQPFSYQFKGMTPVPQVLLFPDGAKPYLPTFKGQSGVYMDTFGCVSHSFNKGVRAYLKARYDLDYNYADRDLVVLSGTIPNVGNTGNKVLKTAQDMGLIPYEFEDFDLTSRDPIHTVERYYAYARVPEAQPEADKFNEEYEIYGEWVTKYDWKEASKYGALQVYVNAWHQKNGEYYNPTGRYNHAVLMSNYDTREISDTYHPEFKTLRSWDDCYFWALKINVIKKYMTKPNITNNSLVILVEGHGGIGLYLDGKIIVDNEAKLNSVFMARNSKDGYFSGGPTISLTLKQWNAFPKTDLAGRPL